MREYNPINRGITFLAFAVALTDISTLNESNTKSTFNIPPDIPLNTSLVEYQLQ